MSTAPYLNFKTQKNAKNKNFCIATDSNSSPCFQLFRFHFLSFWGFYLWNFLPLLCKLKRTCRRMPSMAEPFIISLLRYFRLPSTSSVRDALAMTLFLSEDLSVVLCYIICGYTELIGHFVENLRKINQGNFSWAILRHFSLFARRC